MISRLKMVMLVLSVVIMCTASLTGVQAETQLWVGELYGARVLVYNLDGTIAKTVNIGDLPNGITQGPNGKVYVVGRNTHNIYRYSAGGVFESTFVTAGSEGLIGIAFAPNGDLYATCESGKVLVYDTAGVYKSTFKTFSGSFPTGITFSGGNVYIADYFNAKVNRYSSGGVGGAFMNTDQFPRQISAGTDGKMYVAEYYAGINRFDMSTGLVDSTWSISGLAAGVSGVVNVPDGIGGINVVVSSEAGTVKMFSGTNASLIRTFDAATDGNYRPYYIGVVDTNLGLIPSLSGTIILSNYDVTKIAGIPVIVEVNGIPLTTLNLDADGFFNILDITAGTYDVYIKASHWLAKTTSNVAVAGATIMDAVSLINGDVEDNNEVDFSDINAVRAAYGSFPGDVTWNERADVDGSGEVDFTDINIVRSNYGEIGD